MNPRTYTLAVDVGQANDYTALVILESHGEKDARKHDLVHAERLREVPYPEQVRRVAARYVDLRRHAAATESSVELVVDATGVGKPILDAFKEARLDPLGVIITAGDSTSRDGRLYRVPKRELVTILQVALQAKRLRIAEGLPLAELLVKELRGFRVRITATGHAKFGNDVGEWREADHDDLVLATALAVWRVESRPQVRMAFVGSGRRPGLPGFRRLG